MTESNNSNLIRYWRVCVLPVFLILLGFAVLALLSASVHSGALKAGGFPANCKRWGKLKKVGSLDPGQLREESGLVASRTYPGRLYHINDSGEGPYFFETNLKGKKTKKIQVERWTPFDVEAIGLGPCPTGEGSCIFLGDIGDNSRLRKNIQIAYFREEKLFSKKVSLLGRIEAIYPDGAKNAEAMVVHPKGDVFIFTKEDHLFERKDAPFSIYRLKKSDLAGAGPQKLEKIGSIDLPWMAFEEGIWGRMVTDASISEDGKRWVILTYRNLFEFSLDLVADKIIDVRKMKPGVDYREIKISQLDHQEGLTYLPGDRSIMISTEVEGGRSPIRKIDCE